MGQLDPATTAKSATKIGLKPNFKEIIAMKKRASEAHKQLELSIEVCDDDDLFDPVPEENEGEAPFK